MEEHLFSQKFFDAVIDDELFNSIKDLAHKVHDEVNQTYDVMPYGYHLDMAVDYLLNYMPDDIDDLTKYSLIFGMYFHDSIEDARLTYNDVKQIAHKLLPSCNETECAELVYALTNEKGRTRDERENDTYFEGIRCTPFASFLKACDRAANIEQSVINKSRMLNTYKKENDAFLSRIDLNDVPPKLIEHIKIMLK